MAFAHRTAAVLLSLASWCELGCVTRQEQAVCASARVLHERSGWFAKHNCAPNGEWCVLAFQMPPGTIQCGSMKVIALESPLSAGRADASPMLFHDSHAWRLSLATWEYRGKDRFGAVNLKILGGRSIEIDPLEADRDSTWKPGLSDERMERLFGPSGLQEEPQ